jgi:DNA-binding winged helix-turn-helix (wHTH) protein
MTSAFRGHTLRFDQFTLDLSRCVLLHGEAEVPLRPKAFDLLGYLAQHTGRVVTKDELLQAVWPGLSVTDDSLVQCIRDIRQALGDRNHQMIKTAPRRGYIFVAQVSATHASIGPESPAQIPQHAGQLPSQFTYLLGKLPWRFPIAGKHMVALLVCAAVATTAGLWTLQTASFDASAAYHAVLGRTIMLGERSAKANREALSHFTKALSLDPNSVPALLGYATMMIIEVGGEWVPPHERPQRLDLAEAAIERALKREPESTYAHQIKGVVLRMRGFPDRAVIEFKRALALQPENAITHAEFGRLEIEFGRSDEALAEIKTALLLQPPESVLHIWYCWAGMAAVHAGSYPEAIQWLLKAREIRPTYLLPVPFLAVAYAESGREAEGRALMAEHLTRKPNFTLQNWKQDFPAYNPVVASQRDRIAQVLSRLGVPNQLVHTGAAL